MRLNEAHVGGDDGFVDVVNPETSLGAGEGIGGEERFAVIGVGVFEELIDDERFVERLALIFEGRNEAFWVNV